MVIDTANSKEYWDNLELEDSNISSSKRTQLKESELYKKSVEELIPTPNQHAILNAIVTQITNKYVIVDINSTEDAYIRIDKESKVFQENIEEGNNIYVKVINNPNKDGYIAASYGAAIKEVKYREIFEAIGHDVGFIGKVLSLVHGGFVVDIEGIETFMPGSLAGMNKLHDFESIIGTELIVKAINFERGNIIVSHKDYLKTLIPGTIEMIEEELDSKFIGTVTGTAKYGIFCEFKKCLTGMIPVTDLDEETLLAFNNREIKPGDTIEFFVKDIISDRKINLTQKESEISWNFIDDIIQTGDEVKGKVSSIKNYGAFIKIQEGIYGLLPESEYDKDYISKGTELNVKVQRINKTTKRVSLALA